MLALLVESALRSLVLGLAVWLGLKLFRLRNPQLQMMAWMVVLFASLSMPLLMRGLVVTTPAPQQLVDIPRLPPDRIADALTSAYLQPEVPMFAAPAPEPDVQPPPRAAAHAGIDWRNLATGIYLLVGGVMLLRLLTGVVLTWRRLRTARPIREPWAAAADVRVSDAVTMPVTFAATIVLPVEYTEWSALKRQAVLSHESSHIARGDFYILLAAAFNRCVFWFNPLSWYLVRRLAELAEILSDDAAIEVVGDRPSYAEVLLEVASRVGRAPAGLPMARPRTVRWRVERILAATSLPIRIGWRKRVSFAAALVPVVALCAVTIVSGGSPRQAVAQNTPAAEPKASAVDSKGLDNYVGFYRADPKVLPDLVLTVTRQGDRLFEQRTGAAQLELFAENDHDFIYGVLDSRDSWVSFARDPIGRATGMVLHQNGMDVDVARTDAAEAKRAADLYEQRFADQARPRTAIAIDPSRFDRYVGTYALNPQFVFRMTRDGDRFFTQLTGQPKVEVFPETDNSYFAKVVNAQITFMADAVGQVTGLVLHQSGREFPAPRVDEVRAQEADAAFEAQAERRAEQARPRTGITLDPPSLDRVIGFYEAGPQSIFTITRTGDQLFAQLTNQRALPIFPEGESEYFYKAVAAQITFVADAQGRTTGLVLHQNGHDIRAARIGEVPTPDGTLAVVDPATLDNDVGWYEPPPPRNIVAVTRDGDHLFAQETGQARIELAPRSATGFSGSNGFAILFGRADQDRPSSVIVYDGARGAIRAARIDEAQAHQDEAVATRRIADAPERFKNQMPAPGSEEALRHQFAALARGAPDYDQMDPRSADVIRQQLQGLLFMLTALGPLEQATFKGVGPGGFDVYDVKFAHGAAQVRLNMTADGKVQLGVFRPDGDGTPGAVVSCSQEATLRPNIGAAPIRMTFVNRSGGDVRVFGLDFEGKRVSWNAIPDEGSAPIFATITQPVVVTDASERCLEIVLPGTATQNLAITSAVPDGAPAQPAAPRNTPMPGSEAALRQLIDGIRRGEPDYARMSVQAANGTRQQLRLVQAILDRMGPVQSLSFVGVASTGADIYQVKCENGSAEVRLDLLKDGRIGSLTLGPE